MRSFSEPEIDPDTGQVLWVPIPARTATELYPGLWLGSCARGAGGQRDPNRYDVVITCCAATEEEPLRYPAPRHIRFRMRDTEQWTPDPDALATLIARITELIRADQQVLLRCWAGLNRSGLLAVLALAELTGLPGETALTAARAQRSKWVLCNAGFAAIAQAVPARPPARVRASTL